MSDPISKPHDSRSNPLVTSGKILSLCFRDDDLVFTRAHLVFGLICTWIVGMGRYWDHPDPGLLQRLGLGSVIYVFVLTFLLWILLLPLRLKNLSYPHLLTVITLTAPPAILYAIPVERFVTMPLAQAMNAWFLGIVALWRVSVYFRYLRVYLKATIPIVIVMGLLPLCGIITSLVALNLERVVFDLMAGMQSETGGEKAYEVLIFLTFFSVCAAPFLLIGWLVLIGKEWGWFRKKDHQ